jgi:GTP cyclohydrolase I
VNRSPDPTGPADPVDPDPTPLPRSAGEIERAASHLSQAFDALGLESSGPHFEGTADRVARLWLDLFSGLDPANAPEITTFANPDPGPGMILARGLSFHSMCAHHLLPFFGRAHVAYLPAERVVGLGMIARLVDHHARRPTLQESLTAGVADDLARALSARGVAVLLEGRHLCLEMRGARRNARVETAVFRGAFEDDARRAEFLSRIRRNPARER